MAGSDAETEPASVAAATDGASEPTMEAASSTGKRKYTKRWDDLPPRSKSSRHSLAETSVAVHEAMTSGKPVKREVKSIVILGGSGGQMRNFGHDKWRHDKKRAEDWYCHGSSNAEELILILIVTSLDSLQTVAPFEEQEATS